MSRRVGLRHIQSVGKGVRPLIGDLIDEPWDSLVGWSADGAGSLSISPPGQLRVYPSSGYFLGAQKFMTLADQMTIEFRAKADSFGANGGIAQFTHPKAIVWPEKNPTIYFYIRPTVVQVINQAGGKDEIACATDNDWHTWRLLIDILAPSVKVYKDNGYVGEFTSIYLESGDSYIEFGAENTTGLGILVHYDWSKADSGLKPP